MPLYEYSCPQCGRFELIRKFSDPAVTVCPTCGKDVQKLQSAPAIQFKGTGWYITDYSRKSSGGDGASKTEGSKAEGSTTSSSSEGTESKTAAAPAKDATPVRSSDKK